MRKQPIKEVEAKKSRGEKLTRKENYQILAKKAARFYYDHDKWSSLELGFKLILEGEDIIEKRDYIHNYEIPNGLYTKNGKEGKFELDFYFPTIKTAIELNPGIWHIHLGKTEKKDARKWTQIEKLNILPLFINDITDKKLKELAIRIGNDLDEEASYRDAQESQADAEGEYIARMEEEEREKIEQEERDRWAWI